MSTATNQPSGQTPGSASGNNQHTLNTLLARASELGEQAGRGKDTQVKFLLSCCEGGYHSAVDLQPDKHGTEVDDATKLAETYVKAQGTATTFDAKAPNQRKLVSTLRTSIKLGMWPNGGSGEPLSTIGNLLAHRQSLRKDPVQAKKLDDAANTFLRYARAQLKRDTLIDGEELKSFCHRKGKDPVTAEERVESLRNQVQKLYKGGRDGVQDHSAKVKEAMDALTQRLIDIAKSKGKAQPGGAKP